MAAGLVAEFEAALDGIDVGWTETPANSLGTALEDVVDRPVVGAPLSYDDLSLPGWIDTQPTADALDTAATGVTASPIAVAEYGTLVVQSRPGGDEPVSLYPERHVAVVRESDLVPDLSAAMSWLGDEFTAGRDSAVFATGASATADMGALVTGVHGPRTVHAVVVTDR